MYWAVSIASTQMVGVYQRWKHEHWAPELPGLVGIFVLGGAGMWLAKEKDKYSKTERRVLRTAQILALALGAIGLVIISMKEPYRNSGGD